MPLNKIPNSTAIDTFIAKHGRPPEYKNFDDICAVADYIKHNYIMAMDTTPWFGYYMEAARHEIVSYWKAKRLAKKA